MSELKIIPSDPRNDDVCETCDNFYPRRGTPYGQCRVVAPSMDEIGWATWPKIARDDIGCSLHSSRSMTFYDMED
jgi:hypothetical protein